MKVTQMPPVHAANLVAHSGNTAYGVGVIGELRNGHVANLQELYYTRLVRKMAWYKILIQVLIV